MLPGMFDGSFSNLINNVSGSTSIDDMIRGLFGPTARFQGPDRGGAGGFNSGAFGENGGGFRPPPAGGFPLTPPNNYWQGGQFMAPGVSGGSPLMTSDVISRFPNLAGIAGGGSPPPPAAPPAMPQQQQPDFRAILERLRGDPQAPGLLGDQKKKGGFDKLLGGLFGAGPGLLAGGGGGGSIGGLFGLLPGLLSD